MKNKCKHEEEMNIFWYTRLFDFAANTHSFIVWYLKSRTATLKMIYYLDTELD